MAQLLLSKGVDLELRDSAAWTALHRAAAEGSQPLVRLLLQHRSEIDAKSRVGQTAFHVALANQHALIAQLLLDKGCDGREWQGL